MEKSQRNRIRIYKNNLNNGFFLKKVSLRLLDLKQISTQLWTSGGLDYFLKKPILDERMKSGICLFTVFRGRNCVNKTTEWICKGTKIDNFWKRSQIKDFFVDKNT